MNAAVLAIGTEITSGQIENSHATWISGQIDDFGVVTTHHLAVPDDHELILEALDYILDSCEFLFITGGLGPTRDDFTRNVIADWLDCELEWHEDIWLDLQERLNNRNVKISPQHKNQCYFPEDAQILLNRLGTAHGFYLIHNNKHIWVLPGPTPELQGIWSDHIHKQLASLTQGKTFFVKKWRCLGLPESEVSDLAESTLENSHLQTGYRLASPYVEVKVWVPIEQKAEIENQWVKKLNEVLNQWTISKDDEDIAEIFLDLTLKKGPLTLIDDTTQGQMTERLMSLFREKKFDFELRTLSSTTSDLTDIAFDGPGLTLKLSGTGDPTCWKLEIKSLDLNRADTIEYKNKTTITTDRLGKIKTELSLKKAVEWLRS